MKSIVATTPVLLSNPQNGNLNISDQPAWLGYRWILLGIFLLALVVRVTYLLQLRSSPFFNFYMGDGQGYHEWANEIASGNWLGQEVFYQAPLYPYFLGLLYTLGADDLLSVRICQAIIGSLASVLISDATKRIFSMPAGVLAGIMMALYAPAIFFDGLIQKSVLDCLFLSLVIWLLSQATLKPDVAMWFWVGAALGALVLCRENALVFVGAIFIWLGATFRRHNSRRLICAMVFLAGLAMVLSPVMLRNQAVGDGFHLTTSQFGPNLYIGNNEKSDGTYRPLRPGRGNVKYERQDATELAQKATGRQLDPAEVSRYWVAQVRTYITEHPLNWLKLMLKKTRLVWNAIELEDTSDLYTYAQWSKPMSILIKIWHFGVLAPLALLGICITWEDRHKLWLFYLMTAIYAASVVAFYVFARYRYPLVPFLILFAAGGLTQLRPFLNSRSKLMIWLSIAAISLTAVASNWRPREFQRTLGAATRYNVANKLRLAGRLKESENYYRQALDINPNMANAYTNLANVLRSAGELDEATTHYQAAINIHKRTGIHDDAGVHHDYGVALLEQREIDSALDQFAIAMRKQPQWPHPYNTMAWVLATDYDPLVRRPSEAIQYAKRANELTVKQDASVLDTLAASYAAANLFDKAKQTAQQALELRGEQEHNDLLDRIRQRLRLYEQSMPYVQPK